MIEYVNKLEVSDYKKILNSAGWKVLSDKQLQNALDNTMILNVAVSDGVVVGMARLVGDNATHGLLCDVVVMSEYQKCGIGKGLVTGIVKQVYEMLEENEQFIIELLPATRSEGFLFEVWI